MAADDVYDLLQNQEHSEENWKKAWPLLRKKTATECHDVALRSVDEEGIVLSMEIGDHARQPFGLLHGGISLLLAESAASMHSCWGLDFREKFPVGIEISASHIRSATHGVVLARATLIRKSSTLVHHRVEIIEESTGRVLSVIRTTNLLRDT